MAQLALYQQSRGRPSCARLFLGIRTPSADFGADSCNTLQISTNAKFPDHVFVLLYGKTASASTNPFHRRFCAAGKHQRYPVTGREPNQFAGRFGFAEVRRVPDELIKLLEYLALIVNQVARENEGARPG
jgi:hypothetical protein